MAVICRSCDRWPHLPGFGAGIVRVSLSLRLADACFCPVPRSKSRVRFSRSPRLCALLSQLSGLRASFPAAFGFVHAPPVTSRFARLHSQPLGSCTSSPSAFGFAHAPPAAFGLALSPAAFVFPPTLPSRCAMRFWTSAAFNARNRLRIGQIFRFCTSARSDMPKFRMICVQGRSVRSVFIAFSASEQNKIE